MDEDALDAFDDEQPHATADGWVSSSRGQGDALVRIVLTEEQLAASCDMLPSEGPAAEGVQDDRIDPEQPSILEYADDYQALAALVPTQAVILPAEAPVQRGSDSVTGPRLAMVSAILFVTLVIVVIGGRTLVEQFSAAPHDAGASAPPASSSTPTSAPVAASTPTASRAVSAPNSTAATASLPATAAAVSAPASDVAVPSTAAPLAAAANLALPNNTVAARAPIPATPTAPTPAPPQLARPAPSRTTAAARTSPPQLAGRTPSQTAAARAAAPPQLPVGTANRAAAAAGARAPVPTAQPSRTPIQPPAAARSAAVPSSFASGPPGTTATAGNSTAAATDEGVATPAVAASTPDPVTPASAPPAAVVTPPAVASPPALAPETRAVLLTLYRYQEAFSTLDSNAAHAVWPSVDVKALDRAFEQLEQQTFNLQGCNVTVTGTRADASCTGSATYARKVGNRAVREEPRQWHFSLQQRAGQWLIDRVEAR